MHRVRWLKEIKDTISKAITWLKANMLIKQSGFIKTKNVPLMIIILPKRWMVMDRVDGGHGSRDKGRRYSHLFFLLVTSYFSLSFDFSLFFLLIFF